MMLSDIRDYVESLNLAESVYMGKMDAKPDKAFGVYHRKTQGAYQTAIGGPALKSYGVKNVSILIHWNKSPRDTEKASCDLFEQLCNAHDVTVNNETIKFIQPLISEPEDVGTDENGVYEMVIEAAVIYERKGEQA